MARVLLLGGTSEATQLAARLSAAGAHVTTSLAGVTRSPVDRAGDVRSGGFGGADGLTRYLVDHRIDALVDATHPFAAVMPFHAVAAAARAAIPHCRLLRRAWEPVEGDRWLMVADIRAAVAAVSDIAATRVFLTVGRKTAGEFAACRDVWFLVRSIESIGDALPGAAIVLERGPFDVDAELGLLAAHRIDTIVAKNSGGAAAAAKLIAARALGLRVIMVERPPGPDVPVVESVGEALEWFRAVERGQLRT